MTPAETARVLAKAAAFDQRTVGAADVAAWHEALEDLTVEDALAAVTRHYRDTDARLMPSHVRTLAAELVRERRRAIREAATSRALAAESARCTDRSAEISAFVAKVRGVLPAGNPDALRYSAGHWRRVREERERQERAEPNPNYDPRRAAELRLRDLEAS